MDVLNTAKLMPLEDDMIFHEPVSYLKAPQDEDIMLFGLEVQKDAFGNIIGQGSPHVSQFGGMR